MDTHARIAVVGGGIFGSATALGLGRLGYAQVELVERDHLGSGSTALAGGLLSLHTWNDADAQLIFETRQQLVELVEWGREQELPAHRTAWNPVGGLTIGPQTAVPFLEAFRARLASFALKGDLLEATEVRRRFPAFRLADDERALWSSEGGVIESTDLLDLVRAQARELGVRVRESRPVEKIALEKGGISGLRFQDGETARYDAVVVCGGPWTKKLLATCDAYVPLAPYRTQIATIEIPEAAGTPVLHDLSHGFYSRPESETRLLAGDGTQLHEFDPDRFDSHPDADFVEAIAGRVLLRFTHGDRARYRKGWAGLCAGTPDRRPILGPVPGVDGLWVLTGDNGFGLMRGLALGRRLVAEIAGRTVVPEDPGLRSDRFGPSPPRFFPLAEGFSIPPMADASLVRRIS